MTPRNFSILAVMTAVSVVAAANLGGDGTPRRVDGGKVFPDLMERAAGTDRIEITTIKRRLTIARTPDGWVMPESDGYAVRAGAVEKVIAQLGELRTYEAKTKSRERHAKLGLRSPDEKGSRARRITVRTKEGDVLADLIAGNARYNMPGTTRDGVYYRKPGEDQTWLAIGGLEATGEPADWLEPKIIDIADERIVGARIVHPDGETVVVSRTSPVDEFRLENLPPGRALKYASDPSNIATVLSEFELEDARKAETIDFPPSGTIEADFTTYDGLIVTVRMTEWKGAHWVSLRAEAHENAVVKEGEKPASGRALDVNRRIAGWNFRIPGYKASRLRKRMSEITKQAAGGS